MKRYLISGFLMFAFFLITSSVYGQIAVNKQVQVSVYDATVSTIKVRSAAAGSFLGDQTRGVLGRVVAGPITAGGFNWWKVDFVSGLDGWVASHLLTVANPQTSLTVLKSPLSPVARSLNTSPVDVTPNINLGVFRFTPNNNVTLQSLSFNIATTPSVDVNRLIGNFRLVIGPTSYNAASSSSAGLVTFNNLHISLLKNYGTDIYLVADLQAGSQAVKIVPALDLRTVRAIDFDYNGVTLSAPLDVYASSLTLNNLSGISVTNVSTSKSAINDGTSAVNSYEAYYNFTLNNNETNDIYVPKDYRLFLTTSMMPAGGPSSLTAIVSAGGVMLIDTATAYVIPAGSSRSFKVSGIIKKSTDWSTSEKLSIVKINYGSSPSSPTGQSLTTGLENLFVIATFAGGSTSPVPTTTTKPNLIQNGDFSTYDVSKWIFQGNAYTISGIVNGDMRIVNNGSSSPYYHLRRQTVTVKPGTTYEFGGKITATLADMKPGMKANTCQIDLYIPGYLDTNDIVVNQSGTQTFTRRVTIPAGASTTAYLRLLTGYALNGTCSFDDIFLREASGTISEAEEINQMASVLESLRAMLSAWR